MSEFSAAVRSLPSLKVQAKRSLCQDTVAFDLVHPQALPLPAWSAGAHISVATPSGVVRSYSLCGPVDETEHWTIAVKRDARGRGGSLSMADQLQAGDPLELTGGDNVFALHPSNDYVFVAGGIGITPIYAMLQSVAKRADVRYQLHYLTRNAESTAFLNELQTGPWREHVHIHHDHGDLSQALDLWPVFEQPQSAHVYCCGPQGLMDSVRDMTGHWGSHQVHFESFGADQSGYGPNQAFEVVLQSTGQKVTVSAEQSILDALRANGLRVPSSCESGTCGSCKTGLLSGDVQHRDMVLSPDEQAQHIMVCVSRANAGLLVLDL